jgi:spectrin beta
MFQFELKEMKRRQEAAEEAERQRLQAEAGEFYFSR